LDFLVGERAFFLPVKKGIVTLGSLWRTKHRGELTVEGKSSVSGFYLRVSSVKVFAGK